MRVKSVRVSEAGVKKQSELKNTHIPHMNQFIADGEEGLIRFNKFIDTYIRILETGVKNPSLTVTNKVDGAPAVLIWSHMNGYPDNSIGIKSVINNPANSLSSYTDIENKYPDNLDVQWRLKYSLAMAHCIPANEMWQGDCLFAEYKGNDSEVEDLARRKLIKNINGKDYLTYKPNTIRYAYEKESPEYEKINKATFGIAFHTIHKGMPGDLKQSFKIDLSRLKDVPEGFYITKTELEFTPDKSRYDFKSIIKTYSELKSLELKLISDPTYEELVNNSKFRKYWDMFENKVVSSSTKYIKPETFVNDLKEFINSKIQGYYNKDLEKAAGDEKKSLKVKNKWDKESQELIDIVENNKNMLLNYINVINKSTDLVDLLIKGLEQDVSKTSFLQDEEGNYIGSKSGEGFVFSLDGLSGKLVDRANGFASFNKFGGIAKSKSESLTEDTHNDTAIVTMGKFNPITIGHMENINYMLSNYDGDVFWFFSGKQDNKNHPLSSEENVKFANHLVGNNPRVNVLIGSNPFQALSYIYNQGYKNVIYVVGEDRYDRMRSYFGRYKQEDGTYNCPEPTHFIFDNLDVVLSGNRQEGISGTEARNLARSGRFEQFSNITPFNNKDTKEIYDIIRNRMGVIKNESYVSITKNFNRISESNNRNILNEVADPFYNNIFRALKPLILNKISLDQSKITIDTDHVRHPFEMMRLGNSVSTGGAYTEDDLKSAVEHSVTELLDEPIQTSEGVLSLTSISDYNIHSGANASGTFKSFRINGFVDGEEITFYITIKGGRNSNKKLLTPNKILDIATGRMKYTDVFSRLRDAGTPEINLLISTLVKEASNISNVKFSGNLLAGVDYIKGLENSLNPGEVILNFNAPQTANLFNKLNIDYGLKSSLEATINTDLTEVIGSVVLANALSQATGSDNIYIQYPLAANEKLIDYYIYCTDDNRIKVSAKKDSGGKPSATGLIDTILNNYNKTEDHTTEFVKWFRREHIGVANTQGHKNVADKMVEIIYNLPDSGWEYNLVNVINSKGNSTLSPLKIAAQTYRNLQDSSITPTDSMLRALADNINEYLLNLNSRSLIGDLYPADRDINPDQFIRNKAVFCMCKAFVNTINTTGIMRGLNKKFSDSFGRFIQVYCINPKLSQGKFNFKMVFTSMNGEILATGTRPPKYILVEDCANTPPNGEMTTKKIAMKLVH